MYFYIIGKKNIITTSLKNLYIGFRATLNLCKNDVSLKLMYRFFSNLAHVFIMFVRQKYIIQKLPPTSFEVISLKRMKLGSVWALLGCQSNKF